MQNTVDLHMYIKIRTEKNYILMWLMFFLIVSCSTAGILRHPSPHHYQPAYAIKVSLCAQILANG